ncbi:SRPBCC family protein [Tamlana sp. I1]|uniref:SRPBCC family protein n=1 Tax=Tamlana sp. I1 TaxID=2762061 RepID=UPI00189064A6|nr:SRPBCC family protein [Tamlana sp. I1]
MPEILLKTEIHSDINTCFDLARSIDFHKESLKHTDEMPVAGKTTGLIKKGEWVSWEAKHLGFVQHLTTKIVAFDKPHYFVGEMVFGAFKSYRHEHIFKEKEGFTLMIDKFSFETPYGLLGKFVNWFYLKRYITNLLKIRNNMLKSAAESENGHAFFSKLINSY